MIINDILYLNLSYYIITIIHYLLFTKNNNNIEKTTNSILYN